MPRSSFLKFKNVLNRDIKKLFANTTASESLEKKASEIRTALQAYPNVDTSLSTSSSSSIEFKFKFWDCFSTNKNCDEGKFYVPQYSIAKTGDRTNPAFESTKKLGLFLRTSVESYLIPHKILYFYYVYCKPNSEFKTQRFDVYVNNTDSGETWKRSSILGPNPRVPIEVDIPEVLSSFISVIDPELKGTEKQNRLKGDISSVRITVSLVISKKNTATEIEVEHKVTNIWESEDCVPLARTIQKLFVEKLKPSKRNEIKLLLDQDISIRFEFL